MATNPEVLVKQPTTTTGEKNRIFYIGMASVLLLTIFIGFGRSYYLRSFTEAAPLPALIHFHAAVFSVWMLLFFGQTTLIAAGRTDLHRRLGIIGSVLAGLIVILGCMTAVHSAQHGRGGGERTPYPDALAFMVVPLGDIVLFGGFVAAALYYRRQREIHKRLMLLAIIGGFLWPAITRMPFVAGRFPLMFGLLLLFVLAGPVHDLLTRRRVHAVYVIGGFLILASFPLRVAIGNSIVWRRLASWMIS